VHEKSTNFQIQPTENDIIDFIFEKFLDVKKSKKISDLVVFQTRNKYMLMAHNQDKLRILGSLVANHKKDNLEKILTEYEAHLRTALKMKPTVNSHLNVIMHIFGYFARNFNQIEKDQFIEIVRQFKEENIPIGTILAEIEPLVYKFDNTYLAKQTYFLLYANSRQKRYFPSKKVTTRK